jgi:uncharacterized RmlC-like cupin family protein
MPVEPIGTAGWHRPLHLTPRGHLSPATGQTPGMTRYEAISGRTAGSERIWMGETRVAGGMRSADHHHGESETGIYVVSGHPVFVFVRDGEEVEIKTSPGDYVYVPPFTPHREENRAPEEDAVVVLARSTQEAIVVNLPGLRGEERAPQTTPRTN